jgi:hypothetical protein
MGAMGIGVLGQPNIILKRKFRWTLEISTPCGFVPRHFVKVAARPNIEIEETELNFLNAVTWIPGKGKWQPISVTYNDVSNASMQGLYNWVASVYGFPWPVELPQSEKSGWAGTAILMMYDGCGTPLELWALGSVWPQSVNWGDLDYANSEIATVELQLRYSEVFYMNLCGGGSIQKCCQGC